MGDFTRLIINRFTPKSAAIKIQNKNILGKKKKKKKLYQDKVPKLLEKSYFSGHTIGFEPQK